MNQIIELTDNEWGILEHRLDLADCLADALHNDDDATESENEANWQRVYSAAAALNSTIGQTKTIDVDALTQLDKEILADCLDGSTFFCGAEDAVKNGDWSRQQLAAMQRVGRSLERKFNEAGIECRMQWS